MISIQHIEESLSVSYVNAVVSKAGQVFDIVGKDYGVDGAVRKIDVIGGQFIDLGTVFECQLKASKIWIDDGDVISYDIKMDAYNKFIKRNENSTVPYILILMCLPKNEEEWLSITENELILKKSCYYYQIEGKAIGNKSSKRIKIPKSNLFDCIAVNNLLESYLG